MENYTEQEMKIPNVQRINIIGITVGLEKKVEKKALTHRYPQE